MLEGTFYEREPQRDHQSEADLFRMEKILKTREKGKHVEYLVSWWGWPSKYDEWFTASSLKRL